MKLTILHQIHIFYSGMVLAIVMYLGILGLHRYRYKNTDDERKKEKVYFNSILTIHTIMVVYGLVIIWGAILLDLNMIIN